MKSIEKELDKLTQELSENQLCRVCKKVFHRNTLANCIHHVVHRNNYILRYNLNNLIPLCADCHRLVHDKGHIIKDEQYVDATVLAHLNEYKNKSYKDYLLFEKNMTENEYFKECKKNLKMWHEKFCV